MNCLDYRRLLLAGEGESGEMKAHRAQCPACAELAREQARFELELKEALEVPLPAAFETSLADAIRLRRRRFLAAASVAALAAGGGGFLLLRDDAALALACIEFVMKEEAKSIMMGPMPRAEAVTALAGTLPLERIESVGSVRHVGPCPFNGETAYHVVLAVPQGKVTLLVMPRTTLKEGQHALREGLHASVMPLRRGSIGIIGSDMDVVESVAGALRG
ncbi:MAG TPA: DUF3379 family protein [Burkholderiales bacterium]